MSNPTASPSLSDASRPPLLLSRAFFDVSVHGSQSLRFSSSLLLQEFASSSSSHRNCVGFILALTGFLGYGKLHCWGRVGFHGGVQLSPSKCVDTQNNVDARRAVHAPFVSLVSHMEFPSPNANLSVTVKLRQSTQLSGCLST